MQEGKYETVKVCLVGEGSGIVTYLTWFSLCIDSSLMHTRALLEADVNPISRDGSDYSKTLRVTPLLQEFLYLSTVDTVGCIILCCGWGGGAVLCMLVV